MKFSVIPETAELQEVPQFAHMTKAELLAAAGALAAVSTALGSSTKRTAMLSNC